MSKNVLVLSAETEQLGNDILLNAAEKNELTTIRTKSANLVAGTFLDTMAEHNAGKDQLAVGTRLKIFFNQYVRRGQKMGSSGQVIKEFETYFESCLLYTSDAADDLL